jgi:hypothetical protein
MHHNHNRESSTINKIPKHMAYSFLLTGNTLIIYFITHNKKSKHVSSNPTKKLIYSPVDKDIRTRYSNAKENRIKN